MTARRYTESDEDAVLVLLERCFDAPRDRGRWRWQADGSPTGWSRSWVLEREQGIVGHSGVQGFATFVDGERRDVAVVSDLAVDPGHGPAVFVALMRATVGSLDAQGVPLLGFPIDTVLRVGERRRGMSPLARLPQWVRWLTADGLRASRPTRAARLLAPVVPPALAAAGRLGAIGVRVGELAELGEEVDELAADSSAYARCIRVRDSAYLRWRWLEQPGSRWRVLAARGRDSALRGLAVVGPDSRAEHAGAPVGRIADLLARDRAATAALLRAGAVELRRAGCAIAAFDYLDPRRWSRSACRRAGFVERGVGPSVISGGGGGEGHPATERESWYLTRGDSDLL